MVSAAIPVLEKSQTTCAHHKGRQLEMYCEKCNDLTCMKCLSSIHKSNTVCELSEITSQKKQDIKNFIDRIEQQDLVQIGKYFAATDELNKDNDSIFENLSRQLRKQTEKLKQELDKLATETLSFYQKLKEDNTKLIHKYKQDLEYYANQLKQQIQECHMTLLQGSHIEIYDTECETDSRLHLPVKPVLGTVIYIQNKNFQSHLEHALGKVVTSGQEQTSIEKDLSLDDQPHAITQQQEGNNDNDAETRNTLLTETRVVEEWKSPCYITSICPTADDQAWASGFSETLILLDRKSKVIQKIVHKSVIKDISLSRTTQRLWACNRENNILELVSGRLTQRFRTNEVPKCICVTSSDYVFVGMSRNISKYSPQGQVVLTTETAGPGKRLVCSPWRITECPLTNIIAVIDHRNEHDGGDENRRVVAMDTNFQELFVYKGEIPALYTKTPQTVDKPFYPRGIVYDSQGNIIIGDCNNKRILILSGDGEALRMLHTYKDSVWSVGIDRHGLVWSVFGNFLARMFGGMSVKLLQYSDKT